MGALHLSTSFPGPPGTSTHLTAAPPLAPPLLPPQALQALWPYPALHARLALLLSNRAAALLSQGKPLRCGPVAAST